MPTTPASFGAKTTRFPMAAALTNFSATVRLPVLTEVSNDRVSVLYTPTTVAA